MSGAIGSPRGGVQTADWNTPFIGADNGGEDMDEFDENLEEPETQLTTPRDSTQDAGIDRAISSPALRYADLRTDEFRSPVLRAASAAHGLDESNAVLRAKPATRLKPPENNNAKRGHGVLKPGHEAFERASKGRRHKNHKREPGMLFGTQDFSVNHSEMAAIAKELRTAMELRRKWLYPTKPSKDGEPNEYDEVQTGARRREVIAGARVHPDTDIRPTQVDPPIILNKQRVTFLKAAPEWSFEMHNGVFIASKKDKDGKVVDSKKMRPWKEYQKDLHWLHKLTLKGPVKTFCHRRLTLNMYRYHLHTMLNERKERAEAQNSPHRDFYNVRKVDNHVHHSACMNQKHLLRFIKSKLRKHPNDVVLERDGKGVTLSQLFSDLGLTGYHLNIDALDMHAHQDTFHRFDKFNKKYNPLGKSQLRTIFLKTDNYLEGRYLAEITKEIFMNHEDTKYQNAEYRLSIYGKNIKEWDVLSNWICKNELQSPHVKWMIQIPRIYRVYRAAKPPLVKSFAEMLDNIFRPLFEVTLDPSSHPELHLFLQLIVGFDHVDDESIYERKRKHYPTPEEWTSHENPPYVYYSYYLYANIYVLNALREERGLNTFTFRPHAGEAGDMDHVACCFMLADGINHGIKLKMSPVLQYLYYLAQIGISMSPLSNNLLFLEYHKSPFPLFFMRGLNVTLSTDDPLMIHFTKEPLVEEYAVAAQLWKLSPIDMCEIARASVLQSGFSSSTKGYWLGKNWYIRGVAGNDIEKTNVPDTRIKFRDDVLRGEEAIIFELESDKAFHNLSVEIGNRSPTKLGHGATFWKSCPTSPQIKSLPIPKGARHKALISGLDLTSDTQEERKKLIERAMLVGAGVLAGVLISKLLSDKKEK